MPIYTVECRVTALGKKGFMQALNGATEIETANEITLGQIEHNQVLINDLITVFQKNPSMRNKTVFMVEITGLKAPTKKILAGLKPEDVAINRM